LSNRQKVDDVDIKIIKTLLKEPRTSFAKIAKDCDLSTTSIRNRFNIMKKSGIINGAIMQVNPTSFGYKCIAFAYIELASREQPEVLEFLNDQQFAIDEARLTGRHSIVGFVVAKDTDDLSYIVNQIQCHPSIRSISTAIWIDMTHMDHPENLIIEPYDKLLKSNIMQRMERVRPAFTSKQTDVNLEPTTKKISTIKQLDKIDVAIVKLLSKNARLSFRNIAEKLGISPNNVIKRYNELRKEILSFSSITVNLEKLGYTGTAVIYIKVSRKHSVNETFRRILHVPNLIVAIKIFNYSDILVLVPFRALDDLDDLTEVFYNVLGVDEIDVKVDKPLKKWPFNVITELILKKL
jgi:DNA-binding Lrp family transcriptional regulator